MTELMRTAEWTNVLCMYLRTAIALSTALHFVDCMDPVDETDSVNVFWMSTIITTSDYFAEIYVTPALPRFLHR